MTKLTFYLHGLMNRLPTPNENTVSKNKDVSKPVHQCTSAPGEPVHKVYQ